MSHEKLIRSAKRTLRIISLRPSLFLRPGLFAEATRLAFMVGMLEAENSENEKACQLPTFQ